MTEIKIRSGINEIPIPPIRIYGNKNMDEIHILQVDHTDKNREDAIMVSRNQIDELIEALKKFKE